MALHAIAHCRRMHRTFNIVGIFIRVASETKPVGRGRDQLDVGYVSNRADFMATGTAHGNRGVHRLALGLVFMAGNASRGISLRIERHRMFLRGNPPGKNKQQQEADERA